MYHPEQHYDQELATLLARITVLSPLQYKIDDEVFDIPPGPNPKETLLAHLKNTLYARIHCGLSADAAAAPFPPPHESNQFMDMLSRANTSSEGLDRGWAFVSKDTHGNMWVSKNREMRQLLPNTYRREQDGTFAFHRQKEDRLAQPVFYFVKSNTYFSGQQPMMRVYFNIKPEGAGLLIWQLTQYLNAFNIPFSFKCGNHPQGFKRLDNSVLYYYRQHQHIIEELIGHMLPGLTEYLNENISPFLRKIAAGVGTAPDPANGQSFGMMQMGKIAKLLVDEFYR